MIGRLTGVVAQKSPPQVLVLILGALASAYGTYRIFFQAAQREIGGVEPDAVLSSLDPEVRAHDAGQHDDDRPVGGLPPAGPGNSDVPREDKYKAKSFIDTVVYHAGDQVGAWSYAGLGFAGLGMTAIALVALPLSAAWLINGLWLGRRQEALANTRTAAAPAPLGTTESERASP